MTVDRSPHLDCVWRPGFVWRCGSESAPELCFAVGLPVGLAWDWGGAGGREKYGSETGFCLEVRIGVHCH